MTEVFVVVHMLFERGKSDEAAAALAESIEASHDEPGCLLAALHRDLADPDVLVVIERWVSKDAHDAHMRTEHVQKMGETIAPLLAGVPRLAVTEPIEVGESSIGRV
jgi:quinol monooxygenase YgiN